MKNRSCHYIRFAACIAVLGLVSGAGAVDKAQTAGELASIALLSIQANANLSGAALDGNVDGMADFSTRIDAIDAAMADAQAAYAAMERAVEGGDEDLAAARADEVKAALQRAVDAFTGAVPEEVRDRIVEKWKESKTNTGGGPTGAWDPPFAIWKRLLESDATPE